MVSGPGPDRISRLRRPSNPAPLALLSADCAPLLRTLLGPAAALVERSLGVRQLHTLHAGIGPRANALGYARALLAALRVRCQLTAGELHRVPDRGPLIIVANHPLGWLDGLVLHAVLGTMRSDIKVLASPALARVPELRDLILPVDPYRGRRGVYRNFTALRSAFAWLRRGGTLLVFPAGEVAHRGLAQREAVEPMWQPGVVRLLRRTRVPVLPVFIGGHSSRLFQAAGLLPRRVRDLLLPRELSQKSGSVVPIRVGHAIPAERLLCFVDDAELAAFLRLRTLVLARGVGAGRPGTAHS